ncbi:MAG: hypothetical protein O2816_02795 [Planctomycetota bacterium]|nr:hypothetical protein [Planctomycetota bacterium]
MKTARQAAWKILRSGSTMPLREVDRVAAAYELDDRDRGLLRQLIGTEVRRRGSLRAIAAHFAKGKPSADVAAHLRLGIAQLCFLDRIPPHAAVSETVRSAADTLGLARGRYINGVLRSMQRALRPGYSGDPTRDLVGAGRHFEMPVFRDPTQHPLLWMEDALSMPAALAKRWHKRYGEEQATALARLAVKEPATSLVVLEGEREEVAAQLDLNTTPGTHPRVLLAPRGTLSTVFASEPFRHGRLTVQGETALRAAELLEAQEGERVLDLCAAPGGKTVMLAHAGAQVVAVDVNPTRLAPLEVNLARVGLLERVKTLVSDGCAALAESALFDGVLVDAPCSNTGVLAARPGARWRFGPKQTEELCAIQRSLLEGACKHVRDGGRLVYSVCSIEPEEGPQQVKRFLESHAGWELEEELVALPADAAAGGPLDGGFTARLRRNG